MFDEGCYVTICEAKVDDDGDDCEDTMKAADVDLQHTDAE